MFLLLYIKNIKWILKNQALKIVWIPPSFNERNVISELDKDYTLILKKEKEIE